MKDCLVDCSGELMLVQGSEFVCWVYFKFLTASYFIIIITIYGFLFIEDETPWSKRVEVLLELVLKA